jgi:Fuc2NAc and GlcNAc transferase
MGDVGSIFLGFVFASFVVRLSVTISIFLCLVMFLCTFYADAIVTIYYRWKRGENMMQAHRSHLYQYLSNELKLPHWQVSLMYAIVQLSFGALAILAYQNGVTLQIVILVVFSSLFVISYSMIKKIKPKIALQ